MKVNLIGGIFGTSGYSAHVRGLANALKEMVDVHLDSPRPAGWEVQVSDQELLMLQEPHYDDGYNIFVGQPPAWPPGMNLPGKAFWGFVVWEGDRVPKSWLQYLVRADGLFVPSTHVAEAIRRTDDDKMDSRLPPIVVVPHGVDHSRFTQYEKPPGPFTFLCNKGWAQGANDRGGLQYVLRAFVEEFGPDEPVILKAKINMAYAPPGWNLTAELQKIGVPQLGNEHPRKILICTDSVVQEKMPEFYEGDVYVSATMGEAFDLPCLEAMSRGLPVITTAFGGQTDYVNLHNGWLVPFDLEEVTWSVAYEGVRWARPHMASLMASMREAYEHPDIVGQKGAAAFVTSQRFSWRVSAQRVVEALNRKI